MLNNNFFYTQVAFAYVLDNTDAFFLFFFSKILVPFACFILRFFFIFFDKIYLPFSYTQKKL